MLVVLHHEGRSDVSVCTKACVGRPGVGRRTGPGEHGERWILTSPARPKLIDVHVVGGLSARSGVTEARAWGVLARRTGRWVDAVVVPDWLVVAVTGLLPAVRLAFYLLRRRPTVSGCCPTCGYDLRATPERCPECGHVPTTGPALRRAVAGTPARSSPEGATGL